MVRPVGFRLQRRGRRGCRHLAYIRWQRCENLLAGKELVQLPADNEILSTVMVELRQPLAYPGHSRIGWRKSWETLPITEMKLSKNGSER